jgi:CheY-like chemotaxis protein
LRADRRTAPIPVVFCMARGEGREHQRLRALGAAGVIAKPFDAMRLAAEVRRIVAVEGVLSPVRECFLQRLEADAGVLSARRQRWTQRHSKTTLTRIREIAHSLADAGGIYGFAGITCASAGLSDAAEDNLAGRAPPVEVERALNRLLDRIAAH